MRNTKSGRKLDMILDLYRQEEYLTYIQIAEKTGVCEATVKKCIDNSIKEGIVEKRKQKRKQEISQKTRDEYYEVLKLYQQEEYLTYEKIAKKVGIPLTTVYTYIKKAIESGMIEKRKISAEDRIKKNPKFNMIVVLYEQEEYLTYQEMAERIGINETTVYSYIRKGLELGLIERREPREKEKREKNFNIVLELYQSQENLSYAEISRRSNIPKTTVRIYVEKAISMGLVERRKEQNKHRCKRKENERKKSRYIEAIRLYKEGHTIVQIADELEVSKTSVYNYLKQAEEKGLIVGRHKKRTEEERLLTVSLGEFTEQIKGYIKAKDYKTAIELIGKINGYFQDENPEDIIRARKEIKEELERARLGHTEKETPEIINDER